MNEKSFEIAKYIQHPPDRTASGPEGPRDSTAQAPALLGQVFLDGVLWLTIDRPQRRNALSLDCLDALGQAFRACASRDELKLVVVRGAGDKAFAAGGDLQEFDTLRTPDDARGIFDRAAVALDAVRACPVPVVAALNGIALGGGAELALACDYRVAAAHARIGFVQATLGITSGFSGGQSLRARLGPARALRLLAQAQVLTAAQARECELVDHICAPGQELERGVLEFAAPFLEREPHLLRALKQAVCAAGDLGAQRAHEREAFAATWAHALHWDCVQRLQRGKTSKENA